MVDAAEGPRRVGRGMSARLTETLLKGLTPPARGERFVYDADVTGFAVKLYAPTKANPQGARTFVLTYRRNGTERRYRIGSWPDWSVTAARDEAKDIRRRVDRGEDPATERRKIEDKAFDLEQSIARKTLAFLEQNIKPACYLYRHYHPNGDLLYVGISLSVLTRLREHLREAAWRLAIHRIVIEPFKTREEALKAETVAIKTEFPKFNSVHNGRDSLAELLQLETMKLCDVPVNDSNSGSVVAVGSTTERGLRRTA